MQLRLLALFAGLCALTAGCGAPPEATVVTEQRPSAVPESIAPPVDAATAERAFGVLAELDEAWRRRDCAAVAELTTGAEKTLGGRACEATRNGRPALPGDPVFFLPDAGDWFAALARKPSPAYYVFQLDGDRWRLAAGPVPAHGEPVSPGDPGVAAGREVATRARLVPQRHLTYLTDPAGVNGVRFPSGDPVRKLLDELAGKPAEVAPDRLSIDVELAGEPARTVALSTGSVLVFDVLRIGYEQRPGPGRKALKRPLEGLSPEGSELVVLASVVSAADGPTTVGLRRGPAG
ncbi:hypothetical protein AB0C18_13460 [Nonomuraea muscovyensis]|uniref:hypothetical protein n=1 Tax=Nonomuraea muscovyensis TaxID=1124761 RepID=UPI0033E87DB6|nr:hypothetical protein [Nonomuraea muscovyensis]